MSLITFFLEIISYKRSNVLVFAVVGMAVAEFSVRNKPVLTYFSTAISPSEKFHIDTLNSSAFFYKSPSDIHRIVHSLIRYGIPNRDYTGYKQFTPDKVSIDIPVHIPLTAMHIMALSLHIVY